MHEEITGKVIRILYEDKAVDFGRIVFECRNSSDFFFIPFPREKGEMAKQRGRRLLAPRRLARSELSLLGGGREVLLIDYVPPPFKIMTVQLSKGTSLDKNRRNFSAWTKYRDEKKAWIEPIVSQYGEYELLELGLVEELVKNRAKELGLKDPRKIEQAIRQFLLGCGDPNALLPAWGNSGGKNLQKLCAVKTGRPSKRRALPDATPEYILTETSRQWLCDGWQLFKKARVSVHTAYLLTCVRYFPGLEVHTNKDGRRYSIAPRSQRPTENQFRTAAKKQGLTASRINMGERVHRLTQRALTGNASDGVYAVGQLGLIDSTSEDQTPVSSINRLKVLPSTYRTVCMDVRSEYILGMYCGFEYPSTLTSLLCILNCVESKVDFCKAHGIVIEEGEWHSRLLKRIRGDNGELKSNLGMETMNSSEVAAEFVRSYCGDMKGVLEASHKTIHRQADHHAAGSTRGKRKERGGLSNESEACRSFEENMPHVIRAVLRHNNEELVPHLLTVEMRRVNVPPTRRAIYEWYVENGYVVSEPTHIDTLRVHCLPKLKAVIRRDGVHIFDPRDTRRLVPNLVFTSTWLADSSVWQGRATKNQCEVMLDPQRLSVCYLYRNDQIHELRRKTTDPLVERLALCEYLAMTDDDWLIIDEMRPDLEASDAKAYASNQALNRFAKKAKATAKLALTSNQPREDAKTKGHEKRRNRAEELERIHHKTLGIHAMQPVPTRVTETIPLARTVQDATLDLMAEVRNRRSTAQ